MRREGTRNLVAAALAAGVHRFVVQSIAWMYAPGPEPHGEDDPLDVHAAGMRAVTADGVATLERLTVASPPIDEQTCAAIASRTKLDVRRFSAAIGSGAV